jgi:hypothetical protein
MKAQSNDEPAGGPEVLAVVALLTMFRRRGWMGKGRRS